jgi:hypothetical protein
MQKVEFLWNAVKVDGVKVLCSYSAGTYVNLPEGTITIYGKRYVSLPVVDGLEVKNDSDMQSDYHENDRIRVLPGTRFYDAVLAALKKQEAHNAKIWEKKMARAA